MRGSAGNAGLAGEQTSRERFAAQHRGSQRLARARDVERAKVIAAERATRAPRDRQLDLALRPAVRVVTDDSPLANMGAPHEPLRVYGQAIGEFAARGVELDERAAVDDLPCGAVEIVGEDRVAKALGVVHRPAVRAPPGAIRAHDV